LLLSEVLVNIEVSSVFSIQTERILNQAKMFISGRTEDKSHWIKICWRTSDLYKCTKWNLWCTCPVCLILLYRYF
jgi:hypothetical protein